MLKEGASSRWTSNIGEATLRYLFRLLITYYLQNVSYKIFEIVSKTFRIFNIYDYCTNNFTYLLLFKIIKFLIILLSVICL